jgi:hypothetical protein
MRRGCIVRSDDKRAPPRFIAHLLGDPAQKRSAPEGGSADRSTKHEYDDEATLVRRRFVRESTESRISGMLNDLDPGIPAPRVWSASSCPWHPVRRRGPRTQTPPARRRRPRRQLWRCSARPVSATFT